MREQIIQFAVIRDFDPDHIFDCGQAFRWTRQTDGSYSGIAGTGPANIAFDAARETVTVRTLSDLPQPDLRAFWSRYLDLDRDYGAIRRALSAKDPVMAAATAYGSGIRILNQDLWETVISFLLSQNNNIPRIKGCIEALCRAFGPAAGTLDGRAFFHFPTAQTLAALSPADLQVCRPGYRADYVIRTAQLVCQDGGRRLAALIGDRTEAATAYLLSLPGIGPKVAGCILLFGLHRFEIFPIDVWMRRIMHQAYGLAESDTAGMQRFAAAHFGGWGGIAQQYLFYYIREKGTVTGPPDPA